MNVEVIRVSKNAVWKKNARWNSSVVVSFLCWTAKVRKIISETRSSIQRSARRQAPTMVKILIWDSCAHKKMLPAKMCLRAVFKQHISSSWIWNAMEKELCKILGTMRKIEVSKVDENMGTEFMTKAASCVPWNWRTIWKSRMDSSWEPENLK